MGKRGEDSQMLLDGNHPRSIGRPSTASGDTEGGRRCPRPSLRSSEDKRLEDEWDYAEIFSSCLGGDSSLGDQEKMELERIRDYITSWESQPGSQSPAPGQAGHSSWRNGKEAAELIDNVYNAFSNGRVSVRDSDGHWLSEEALKAEPVYPVTRSLGFQNYDPRTDIRSGRWCVEQFSYLATEHKDQFITMARQAEDYEYTFAITAFSVSFMIVKFFDLFNLESQDVVKGGTAATRVHLRALFDVLEHTRHDQHMKNFQTVLHLDFYLTMKQLHEEYGRVHEECRQDASKNRLLLHQNALRDVQQMHARIWGKGDIKSISDLKARFQFWNHRN